MADGGRSRIPLTARVKIRNILQRHQGYICGICGLPMRGRCSFEHVNPLCRGGFDGLGNAVAAHRNCNNKKGDRPPTGCELLWLYAVNLRLGIAT